jgi:hypothetical protein
MPLRRFGLEPWITYPIYAYADAEAGGKRAASLTGVQTDGTVASGRICLYGGPSFGW